MSYPNGAAPPAPVTEFFGRERELAHLHDLLRSGAARLITLVGPGGIGKTRLAAESLRRCDPGRPVYWARLAELERDCGDSAENVLRSVVRTDTRDPVALDVGVGPREGSIAGQAILVLDNCEHVLAAVGRVVIDLLTTTPGLTILATSREPIGWADEYILTVPPLSSFESLQLFRRRAALTGRPIRDDPDQLAIVRRICRRVERNPLFIRLAAARLRHQPPAMVLAELSGDAADQRMHWSQNARSGTEQRHRGVYDVIAWSFDLCEPDEQLLLQRMAVFAAGYETDGVAPQRNGVEAAAVAAVCSDEALPAERVAPLLERLAECSLVATFRTETSVRWYLVESVRLFVGARLRHVPTEAVRVAGRHRRYHRDRVVEARSLWYGPQEQAWLEWVRASWDDILIGIETGLADPGEALIGLETASVLLSVWVPFVNGGSRALTRLTAAALDVTRSEAAAGYHIRATALLGWYYLWQGDADRAAALLDDCVARCMPEGIGAVSWRATPETDIGLPASVEWIWGLELMLFRLDPRAITVLERAGRKFTTQGDRVGVERGLVFAALAASMLGDPEAAERTTRQHLERSVASGSASAAHWARVARALALARSDDPAAALEPAGVVVFGDGAGSDTWMTSWSVAVCMLVLSHVLAVDPAALGAAAAARARATELAWLVGVFRACHRTMGICIERVPMVAAGVRHATETATTILGPAEFAAAEQRGSRLHPGGEEVRQHLRNHWPVRSATPISSAAGGEFEPAGRAESRWNALSPAEREIAVLAAAGWPNSAIAERRGSSVRTVDAQVASIRQKLMIASRRQISDHIPGDLAERVGAERTTAGGRPRTRRR
ncbi:ATP-binding protein [Nocardia sp. NBC_01329]|uniref:ATP-binding protein n=1 Tax=Nocardia sp. NBC_01329 TaxID=2903594 RepID=UPI002E13E193|nr:AAA family ATPase [Nocardia sp. NBC_01329]